MLTYRKSALESRRKTYIPRWDPYQPEMILPTCFTFLGFIRIWVLHSTVLKNYKISVSSGQLAIGAVGLQIKKSVRFFKYFFLIFSIFFMLVYLVGK